MMKKIIPVLIIMLVLTGCGAKEETAKKQGNEVDLQPINEVMAGPSEAVPTESDENTVGLMAFYPNNNENMYALAGTNTMTFYFQNKGITLGSGKIGIYQKDGNTIYASVEASDPSKFEIGELDEIGTSLTSWTEGTKIDAYFDHVFLPGQEYYVLMDEGCFELGTVHSNAVTNASLINFGVKKYGVDLSHVDLSKTYSIGDAISFDVKVDGVGASMFAFREYQEAAVTPYPVNSTSSTTASISFIKDGAQDITIGFYNSGKQVDSLTLHFNVVDPVSASSTPALSNTNAAQVSDEAGDAGGDYLENIQDRSDTYQPSSQPAQQPTYSNTDNNSYNNYDNGSYDNGNYDNQSGGSVEYDPSMTRP